MTSKEVWLQAFVDARRDDLGFLAYCDWAEEQGNAPQTALIRRHIALRNAAPDDDRWKTLQDAQRAFAEDAANKAAWDELRDHILPFIWHKDACAAYAHMVDAAQGEGAQPAEARVYYSRECGLPSLNIAEPHANSESHPHVQRAWPHLPRLAPVEQFRWYDNFEEKYCRARADFYSLGICNRSYDYRLEEGGAKIYSNLLITALEKQDTELLRELLEHGADANKAKYMNDTYGASALHIAVEHGDFASAELLLAHKADPNWVSRRGELTPLAMSVRKGDIRLATLLLEHGGDPDYYSYKNYRKVSPSTDMDVPLLHMAYANNDIPMMQLLSQKGASIGDKVSTPGYYATDYVTVIDRARKDKRDDVIETILEHKTSLNDSPDYDYVSLAEWAMSLGKRPIARRLLEAGIDVKKPAGKSLLEHAASYGWTEEARLLLQLGADVNAGEINSPLSAAVGKGDKEMALLLLGHGADVNRRSGRVGFTPLEIAIYNDDLGMMRFLLEHGAAPKPHIEYVEYHARGYSSYRDKKKVRFYREALSLLTEYRAREPDSENCRELDSCKKALAGYKEEKERAASSGGAIKMPPPPPSKWQGKTGPESHGWAGRARNDPDSEWEAGR